MHPCPLCNRPARRIPPADHREFRHCRACDLISVSPDAHLTDEQARQRYALHENTLDDPDYARRLGCVVDLVAAYCPGARRVLDYGSGPNPALVELLRRGGFDACGYDPHYPTDPEALANRYDVVVSTETFEHFANPLVELQRIRALLVPQGCLAIMTLFHRGPAALADWWYARDPTHVAFYSVATIVWICNRFAFTPVFLDSRNFAILRRR